MGPQLRNDIHELVTDDNAGPDRETIIHEAQEIWKRYFGSARASGPAREVRMDRGVKRPRPDALAGVGPGPRGATLTAYLGLRRASVDTLHDPVGKLPTVSTALEVVAEATQPQWTPRMQQEAEFNERKWLRAAVEAVTQQAALPEEEALLRPAVYAYRRTQGQEAACAGA